MFCNTSANEDFFLCSISLVCHEWSQLGYTALTHAVFDDDADARVPPGYDVSKLRQVCYERLIEGSSTIPILPT
jgi:hypothetical protein